MPSRMDACVQSVKIVKWIFGRLDVWFAPPSADVTSSSAIAAVVVDDSRPFPLLAEIVLSFE